MPAHAQPTQSGSNNIAASDNGRTGSHDRGQESPSGEEAEQGVQLFDERTTSEELREIVKNLQLEFNGQKRQLTDITRERNDLLSSQSRKRRGVLPDNTGG